MDIPLSCQCGALKGLARDVTYATSIRARCYCDDCQAYAHHLGRAHDVLDENGGTDISSVVPAHLSITSGADQLRCVRLTEKGMYRWYAGCCQTPIANSAPMPKAPFAGVFNVIMDHESTGVSRDDVLGPLEYGMMGRFGIGELPPWASQGAPLGFLMRVVPFMLCAFIKRQNRPSPFFDSDFKPRVKPVVLTHDQRELLRALCGPEPHDQPTF